MNCPECGSHVVYDPNGYYCGHCDWEESTDSDEDEADYDDEYRDDDGTEYWVPDYDNE